MLTKITEFLQANRSNTANAHYLYAHIVRLEKYTFKNDLVTDYSQSLQQLHNV